MRIGKQTGEGKLSGIIWLALLAALLYAGWNVGPVYMANYVLADKMNEIARSPRGTTGDDKIYDMLMKEVREQGLVDHVRRQNFRVQTLETSRKITLDYERPGEILPGWKHIFRFHNVVDQPLLW
jgi:hypothetical protein